MGRPTKSLDVRDRQGVYKRLDDVPDRFRLYQNAQNYRGYDVWQEFCENHEYTLGESHSFKRKVDRAGDLWREFIEPDTHHALATPEDVEDWSTDLLDRFTLNTAYKYWIRIEHFYQWLQWHTEHPHVYHPVLMAAGEYDAAGEIWAWKTGDVQRMREERKND